MLRGVLDLNDMHDGILSVFRVYTVCFCFLYSKCMLSVCYVFYVCCAYVECVLSVCQGYGKCMLFTC